jgi:hypothetical protein
MRNTVIITANFASPADFRGCNPSKVSYSLNQKDSAKLDKVLEYHLNHDLFPQFVPVDPVKDGSPVEAFTWFDLNLWSNDGLPKFKMRDEHGKVIEGLPNANSGKKKEVVAEL